MFCTVFALLACGARAHPQAHMLSCRLVYNLGRSTVALTRRHDRASPVYKRPVALVSRRLAFKHDWATKYRIYIGENWQILGSYSEHLARSIFCVVAPGEKF